jgi:3D (Asp-Asp-Asp) domain-containing protein
MASVLRSREEMLHGSTGKPRSRMRLASTCVLLAAVIGSDACATHGRPSKPDFPTTPVRVTFSATAYCKGKVTAAGTAPTKGTVAADPAVLPLGSRIRLTGLDARYDGDYVVLDTGAAVRGRRIDLYIRDCREATRFGHRTAAVTVLHR